MPNPPVEKYFIGVDVGPGSARAGVFDNKGVQKGAASAAIQMWKPAPDYVEQSSENIWARCCEVVRSAVENAGIAPDAVGGLGFDATSSFVALRAHRELVS